MRSLEVEINAAFAHKLWNNESFDNLDFSLSG